MGAETEEKSQQKKTSKKNKNKKKKEKAKQKKATPPAPVKEGSSQGAGKDTVTVQTRSLTGSATSNSADNPGKDQDKARDTAIPKIAETIKVPLGDDDEKQNQQPSVDFVLYLQQTGSIIALAKLMDALEYGEDLDEGLDDSELQLIREQQMLNQQQATTQ